MDRKQFVSQISLVLLLVLLSIQFGYAQPDCRSILGAHLKPLKETNFSWATEGAVAGAFMNDRKIANGSLYLGTEYSFNKSRFYFEGAFKNWYNSASNPDGESPDENMVDYNKPTRYHMGLRELYYSYGKQNNLKLGVQSIKSPDYLMIDERVLALSINKSFNSITISGQMGSVSQRIARFQDVFGNRHVYNILHRSQYNFVGERPGESNFGSVFLTWKPNAVSLNNSISNADDFVALNGDEFESFDEFEMDEFNIEVKLPFLQIDELGIFFYEEFGVAFHEYKYYSGVFGGINLMDQLSIKVEAIDQYIFNDHALATLLEMERVVSWSGGNTSQFQLGYLGKIDITEGAHFYPAFTNLFLGELMRLDAIDLPLVYGSVKHFLHGERKWNIQVNGVAQLKSSLSRELDLIIDFKPFKNIRLSGVGGIMGSDLLDSNYWMTKLELRIAI